MNPLFLDSETTAKPLHDPYNPAAKLVYVGLDNGTYHDYAIEYNDDPYHDKIEQIQSKINESTIVVGANLKFDIGWGRRYGLVIPAGVDVWDCLLVEFILNHQTTPYVSLNDVLTARGLPLKLDIVKTEYWDNGLQTTDVPEPILQEYQKQDVQVLKPVFEQQYRECKEQGLLPLVMTHNRDLLMLAEMEWNGILYDVNGSLEADKELLKEITEIQDKLNTLSPIVPRCWSGDFISQILYGGTYKYVEKEPYIFTYKDGSTKEKIHNVTKELILPRLVEPPKKARAKEGFWPTDEATLKKLKVTGTARKIVELLLRMREIEKLSGTYLGGFPKKIETAGWEHNMIHTNYNQAKVVTGRLSSDSPNVQNIGGETKKYFVSRFGG